MVTWWSSDLDFVRGNVVFDPLGFSVRDIVPVGYAAFAFVLGCAAGLLVRRTLPAMLAALVGLVAVRALVTDWVRPYLFARIRQDSLGLLHNGGNTALGEQSAQVQLGRQTCCER
jgi:hypothetical protein